MWLPVKDFEHRARGAGGDSVGQKLCRSAWIVERAVPVGNQPYPDTTIADIMADRTPKTTFMALVEVW